MKRIHITCDGPECLQETEGIDSYSCWCTVLYREPIMPFENTQYGLRTKAREFHFHELACLITKLASIEAPK